MITHVIILYYYVCVLSTLCNYEHNYFTTDFLSRYGSVLIVNCEILGGDVLTVSVIKHFVNPRRMRSEGYSSWSVCLFVCLRLFSHYRLRGGL